MMIASILWIYEGGLLKPPPPHPQAQELRKRPGGIGLTG